MSRKTDFVQLVQTSLLTIQPFRSTNLVESVTNNVNIIEQAQKVNEDTIPNGDLSPAVHSFLLYFDDDYFIFLRDINQARIPIRRLPDWL